jgi:hypothetical protein
MNYLKWIKSIEALYTFNVNCSTKSLYDAIHNESSQNNNSVREEGLRLVG